MLFVSPTPLFVFSDPHFDSGSHFPRRMVAWRSQSIEFRLLSVRTFDDSDIVFHNLLLIRIRWVCCQ